MERRPALDGLRGIAILAVLAERFLYLRADDTAGRGARLFAEAMGLGWVGVQLFFVLSGYLITAILLETRDGEGYHRTFYLRRALRILPLYYAVLLAGLAILPPSPHHVWSWTFLVNWTEPFGWFVPAFHHHWSLGVEEQFYVVWPLVVRRLDDRRLVHLCAVLVVASLVARALVRAGLGPAGPEAAYMFTVCRMDALALGAACAAAMRSAGASAFLGRRWPQVCTWTLGALVPGALATRGFARTTLAGQTLGYTVVAFACGGLLLAALFGEPTGSPVASALGWSPLRSVGRYSYAMYLFHAPLHEHVGRPLLLRFGMLQAPSVAQNAAYAVAAAGVTYLAGLASYHLLEKHFLALKRRLPLPVPAGPRT